MWFTEVDIIGMLLTVLKIVCRDGYNGGSELLKGIKVVEDKELCHTQEVSRAQKETA